MIASNDGAFDRAMKNQGFKSEDRRGKLRIGYYHPDHPDFGFQQVTGPLFEGKAETSRLRRIKVTSGNSLAMPAVEDMIADRLGQHAVASKTDLSRLKQAIGMFRMAKKLDLPYLRRRVLEEGGDVTQLLSKRRTRRPAVERGGMD